MFNFKPEVFGNMNKKVEKGDELGIKFGFGKYSTLLSPTEQLNIGSVRMIYSESASNYVKVNVKNGCTRTILAETMKKIAEEAQLPVKAKFEGEEIIINPCEKIDCRPGIVELDGMIDWFKSQFSLEVLNSIVISEEAFGHPVREPAKKARDLILNRLNALNHKTNISSEESDRLQNRFNEIMNAVGWVRGGKFDKDIKLKVNGGTVEHGVANK